MPDINPIVGMFFWSEGLLLFTGDGSMCCTELIPQEPANDGD